VQLARTLATGALDLILSTAAADPQNGVVVLQLHASSETREPSRDTTFGRARMDTESC